MYNIGISWEQPTLKQLAQIEVPAEGFYSLSRVWSKVATGMLEDGASWKLHACCITSVVSDSCDPMDCSPPGSSVHGDSPGKNTGTGEGCHALLQGIFLTQGPNLLLLCLLHWEGVVVVVVLSASATWKAHSKLWWRTNGWSRKVPWLAVVQDIFFFFFWHLFGLQVHCPLLHHALGSEGLTWRTHTVAVPPPSAIPGDWGRGRVRWSPPWGLSCLCPWTPVFPGNYFFLLPHQA